MAKKIYVPTESYANWQALLAQPDRHWKEGYSAMTLAQCWEAAAREPGGFPPEVTAALSSSGVPELADLSLILAIPEFQVDLPGGQRSSQTDVLAIASNRRGLVPLAVEGKVDESFGPTIGERRKDPSTGVTERLGFLQQTLGLSALDDSIRYQLLHRTVSAVLIAEQFCSRNAVMLVHSFSLENKWFDDFEAFAGQFAARPKIGQITAIGVHRGVSLYIGWCSGDQRFRREQRIGIAEIPALLKALHFAADKHRDQRRKDAEASPYINHPIEVAELLARIGCVTDLITLQGAILHDTIEDTQTTPEELEVQFGLEVRKVVEEVTDDKTLEKAERKRLQVEHSAHVSLRAKQIKLADKIANVRAVTEAPPAKWPLSRRKEYLEWTSQVVTGLRGCNAPLEKLYDQVLAKGRQVLNRVGE